MSASKEIAKAWAQKYNHAVFPIYDKIPIKGVEWKKSTIDVDVWQEEQWLASSGFGIVCRNLTVIDIDKHESLSFLPIIEDTLVVRTRRGCHLLFQGTHPSVTTKIGFKSGIDIKTGDGAYVVGPGTERFDGYIHEVINDVPIADLHDQEYLIEWLLADVVQSDVVNISSMLQPKVEGKINFKVNEGQRNNFLTSRAGSYRKYGLNADQIYSLLVIDNKECVPALEDKELKTIAKSVARYDPEINLFNEEVLNQDLKEKLWSLERVSKIQSPPFIIDDVWPEGGVNVLYGEPGSYKSFTVLDWAVHINEGGALVNIDPDVLGFKAVRKKRKVLYIAAEGVYGLGKRIRAARYLGTLQFLPEAIDISEDFMDLRTLLVEENFKVVIFDTFQKVSGSVDENSSAEIGKVLKKLERLYLEDQIVSMVIHHTNKSGGYRGSLAFESDCTNMWKIEKKSTGVLDKYCALITTEKFRDAEPVKFYVYLEKVTQPEDTLVVKGYSLNDPKLAKANGVI